MSRHSRTYHPIKEYIPRQAKRAEQSKKDLAKPLIQAPDDGPLADSPRQRFVRLPTLNLIEQTTTVYVGRAQYLIRAYVQLEAPTAVFPFEIAEIVGIDKPAFKIRFPAGSVKLYASWTADNFRASEICLKNWASAFLQAQGVG